MKVLPEQMQLYAVTDSKWLNGRTMAEVVEEAILGGATFVQLREKELDQEAFIAEAKEVLAVCRKHGVPFVINDNVEVAKAVDADGVHVGQSDLAAGKAREVLGPDKIIGVSTHNAEEARIAQANGADYLGCGAVFATATKPNIIPITHEILSQVTEAVDIPVVAIGGIDQSNMMQLKGCGLSGVAVVSAIFGAEDIKAASEELLALSKQL